MSHVLYPFAVAALLVAALAAISIRSHQRFWLKAGAIAIVALFLPAAYLTIVDLLSRPKPVTQEWGARALPEATVLSAQFTEGDRIFLWLKLAEIDEPRYYALPWNEQMARQLFEAQQDAESNGTEVRMTRPFDSSHLESERMFYALPQEALPPKRAPGSEAFIYSSGVNTGVRDF